MEHRHRSSQLRAQGFTLLELLVVVGIIALLMGIMIPSLSRSRQQARNTACKQVLHGLSIAMRVYLDENNRIMPPAAQMPSINTQYKALPVLLAAQVQSPKAWYCPADQRGYRRNDGQSFDSYFAGETLSYEYNMSVGGYRIEKDMLFPYLGEQGTIFLSDFDAFHGSAETSEGKYILFADGHVGIIDDLMKQYQAAK